MRHYLAIAIFVHCPFEKIVANSFRPGPRSEKQVVMQTQVGRSHDGGLAVTAAIPPGSNEFRRIVSRGVAALNR